MIFLGNFQLRGPVKGEFEVVFFSLGHVIKISTFLKIVYRIFHGASLSSQRGRLRTVYKGLHDSPNETIGVNQCKNELE